MRIFTLLTITLTLVYSCSVVKTNADLQRYVSQGVAHKVVIKRDIELNGQALSFPPGCSIEFKGGSISNCHITFNGNRLKGKVCFKDCTYKGVIYINKLDDRDYTSADDDGTLRFLIINAIENGAKCEFHRDYRINMNAAPGSGLVSLKGFDSGSDIDFHGHTIYNSTAFSTPHIQPVIALTNMKNVTIRNCYFHDNEGHNARAFEKSKGCTFVYCYGDCERINLLNCSQENGDTVLRSGIYAHNKSYPENTQTIGLSNSTIKVKGINVGYGLVLYCGDNLDIDIEVKSPHRGFYCSGVSNSRITYKGYNPIETKCHILFMDALFKQIDKRGITVLDMKGCHDLDIRATIDEVLPNESIISFQSYGADDSNGTDFSFRTSKCHHYNIDFSAEITRSPEAGYYYISRFGTYSRRGDCDMSDCLVSDIIIHNVRCIEGKARPYMCHVANGIEADIKVENCNVTTYNVEKNYGFDYYIRGNSTGKIHIKNSLMGNVLVREKESGRFDVEVEETPVTRSINYINDNTSRHLVRLIH